MQNAGRTSGRRAVTGGLAAALVFTAACTEDGFVSPGETQGQLVCSINSEEIRSGGVARDGIPSLTDPPLVDTGQPNMFRYLRPTDRVIGLVVDGQPIAVPHNILWWHEIVNLNLPGGDQVAVSFCPLTGSSLAFDRGRIAGQTLGVSGLLFQNNLIMFNRTGGPSSDDSLWPQMMAQARCGPQDGSRLPQFAVVEMTWEGWRDLHPSTLVIADDIPIPRDYTLYPYGNYENLSVDFTFRMPVFDDRRLPKERVIGVPDFDGGGIAFPTLALGQLGPWAAVAETFRGDPIVLLWSTDRKGGMVYSPVVDGQVLAFEANEAGIFDTETGSRWTVMGEAVDGPLAGTQLVPLEETYVAFWGAWVNFHRQTRLWGDG